MLGRLKKAPDQVSPESTKISSIRGKILRRILPVVIAPLLGLGAIAVLGAILIQQRTADAVSDAETILSDQVVADGANRSAETAAREVGEFVDDIVLRAVRINERAAFRESVVEASNDRGDSLNRTQVLALTVRDEITIDEEQIQVVLVAENGDLLGSTHDRTTRDSYAEDQWFLRTLQEGFAFRSFVADGEHIPSFEVSFRTQPPATTSGAAVLRVRVPLSNVQAILDQVADDNAVTAALVDTSASLILADTATAHDEDIVFDTSTMMSDLSGVNLELLGPGTLQSDELVTSARRVSLSNDQGIQFNWLTQTNQSIEVAGESLSGIRAVADDVEQQRQLVTIAVIGLVAFALGLAFLAIRSVANRITAPVKLLSDQAQSAASEGIPAVVEAARTSETLPELPEFEVDTNDELSVLANSLNTMQDAAVDLAAGQAKLRRQNVARTFVSLGRRNQNLLNRQLEFIEELEQQESDPDLLENLFRLDHLATRMRRNAENLLVLAGEQTPRRWGKPISIRDVLRAAAAEIADYRRVKLSEVDPATVSGGLATDLSHLIAELLENAGSFSPPNTPIEVLGQQTSTHYRLAIVDHGIGMDAAALEELNGRLRNPVDFADAPSAYLGLFVVGRLSQELGITVRLASADPTGEGRRRGTIAFVDLPVEILSSETASPIEVNARKDQAVARLAGVGSQETATPEAAPEPAATPITPVAPEPAPAPLPTAAPSTPVGTTSAGFPQRRRRGNEPAAGPADELPVSAPAQAPLAPDVPSPQAPPMPVAEAAPIAPGSSDVTAAGFPKRRSSASGPDPVAPQAPEQPTSGSPVETPKRDASEVSNSLRSFRAAVARGRASTPSTAPATPEPPGAPTAPTVPPTTISPTPPPAATAPPAAPSAPAGAAVPQQPTTERASIAPDPSAPRRVPAAPIGAMPPPAVTAPAAEITPPLATETPEHPGAEAPTPSTTTGSE